LEDDSDHRLLNFFKSLLRKKPHLEKGADLTEEIHDLMNEGQAMGLITNEISDMVYGVLDLKETKAHSIMIPRTEISSASIDSTLGDAIELVSSCGHTRIPIFKENIDEIAGILHAKDLLKLWGQDPLSKIPDTLLRKPYFVPRNKKISELLKDLRREKTHLAIVTDEYGGTAGIITIEDILEEIVGEIMDEHDDEAVLMTPLDDNTVLVDARLDEEKLEEHFGIKLPEGEYESVGGFVIHLLGEIPKVGQKILFQDLEMTVKSADLRKIDKILIRRVPPSVPTEEAQY
jgi:CBS domain containing-hemolysin-like protein